LPQKGNLFFTPNMFHSLTRKYLKVGIGNRYLINEFASVIRFVTPNDNRMITIQMYGTFLVLAIVMTILHPPQKSFRARTPYYRINYKKRKNQ
jgi:hypothetical protein